MLFFAYFSTQLTFNQNDLTDVINNLRPSIVDLLPVWSHLAPAHPELQVHTYPSSKFVQ